MAGRKPTILAFGRTTPKHGLSPVHYYRVILPFKAVKERSKRFEVDLLTQQGLETLVEMLGDDIEGALTGRDIYVISRLYAREGLKGFLDAIHEQGGIVIFDTDDDLTDEFREFGRGNEFVEVIKSMDLVTVSTPFLADRMAEHIGYRPPVLYNHIDFSWFARVSRQAKSLIDGLSVGFVGTSSHYDDWIVPVEALVKLAEEKDITIAVAGFMPDYLDDVPNLYQFPPVRYDHYPAVVRQFDIVCCVLDPDDTFNKSKSAIKAIEAMSAARRLPNGKIGGAVVVCTDMPVYRRAVNHNHNGLLVSNGDWYEALSLLIEDKPLREKISIQGYNWAKKNRDISTGYKHWENLCKKVVSKGVALYK